MSPKGIDKLSQQLLRLRLIELPQIEEAMSQLNNARDTSALLQILAQNHLLTPYQIRKLEKGETEGLVLGPYKLLYQNASGSFARVFRAASIETGEMMGLKVLRQRWAKEPQTVAQFHREAKLCKPLEHKNIVPIFEVATEGDFHYFTMEFVEGGNLRDFMRIRRKLAPLEACRYALDMAEGLNYALQRGITHRDLKMTNVLMSIQGVTKLVDFGLAGAVQVASGGEIIPAAGESAQRALEYAAIEKGTGVPRDDPRTDLFFLGAIFYEMLAGTPPYPPTRSREDRARLSRYATIRQLTSVAPDMPPYVNSVVERLMSVNPIERFQTPEEVIDALRPVIAELKSQENADSTEPTRNATPVVSHNQKSTLPTIMCIENRAKQQNMLRDYLSKHGFRVLVLTDLQRGLSRLTTNPPDCVVLMGESLGDSAIDGFQQAVRIGENSSLVSIIVLSGKQENWKRVLNETEKTRVLAQPVTLRDLRREIHLAFQRLRRQSRSQQT